MEKNAVYKTCHRSTLGLVAMTSAQHAEGCQLDPGRVYLRGCCEQGAPFPEVEIQSALSPEAATAAQHAEDRQLDPGWVQYSGYGVGPACGRSPARCWQAPGGMPSACLHFHAQRPQCARTPRWQSMARLVPGRHIAHTTTTTQCNTNTAQHHKAHTHTHTHTDSQRE